MGRNFEKQPLPPETVPIPDAEINFCQLALWPCLVGVDPFVIQGISRRKGLPQQVAETVNITFYLRGPEPVKTRSEKKGRREKPLKIKPRVRLPARVRPPEDVLRKPDIPIRVGKEHPIPRLQDNDGR